MATTTVFTFGGMDDKHDPASVGTPDSSLRVQDRAYTGCTEIVNGDVDDDDNISRRSGYSLLAAGNVTSAWGDGVDNLCVVGGALYRYSQGALNLIGNSPNLIDRVDFARVNDIVAFSDPYTIGYLKDSVPYVVNVPTQDVDLLDLETWVKLTYPAGADAPESNLEVDAFSIATSPGRCLEFFNGALYMAREIVNPTGTAWFVFCTKTFNMTREDVRFNVVAGFKDEVTMIRGADDGIYVGTTGGVYFLSGDGIKGSASGVRGFVQRKILPFGVVRGSDVAVPKTEQKGKDAVAWLSENGVYLGFPGGQYLDLTADRVTVLTDLSLTAAALVRQVGASWQYLVCHNGQTLAVNLKTGAHSRYTNFTFVAFFDQYGANSSGVSVLAGGLDGTAVIDASFTTPAADFGLPQLKTCSDAYLHARTDGDLTLDLYVDETEVATDLSFRAPYHPDAGLRRLRVKLPRGARGTNWQFKIRNVDGCRFTALSLKVTPAASARSI